MSRLPTMNNMSALVVSEGRRSSENGAHSLVMELMPTLMGAVVSGKLTPFIMPALIKLVVIPLLNIVNTISKAFVLIGVLAYFITFSVPILLTHFDFVGRNLDMSNH